MTRWPPPPRLAASFYKAHGLGNDYLVFEEGRDWVARPDAIRAVCEPHTGVGSDGIVALLANRSDAVFRLRMFNPDGSEFERSGNGLRVLGSYLVRLGERAPFTIEVGGATVRMAVHGDLTKRIHDISVEMGRARVGPDAVELESGTLDTSGRMPGPGGAQLHVVPVSVGNPHMVVLVDEPSPALLAEIGPFLVGHPALAHGANVQLARAVGRDACEALIWERGVGPTTASGTSACAVAVALVSERRVDAGEIEVRMPGGTMKVGVDPSRDVTLRGPVEEVCTGTLSDALLERVALADP